MNKSVCLIVGPILILVMSASARGQSNFEEANKRWQEIARHIVEAIKRKEPTWTLVKIESYAIEGRLIAWTKDKKMLELWMTQGPTADAASFQVKRYAMFRQKTFQCGDESYMWKPEKKPRTGDEHFIICRKGRVYFQVKSGSDSFTKKLARYQMEFWNWN